MTHTAPPRQRPHLVVVDRAAALLAVVRDLFDGAGYTVTATTIVPRSVAELRAMRPALVLLALGEQDWGEWALLDALAQPGPLLPLPRLLVSTNRRLLAEAEARFGTARLRALAQPLDPAQVLATVRALLGAR